VVQKIRRRITNLTNAKTNSPSSTAPRSIKSNDPQVDKIEHHSQTDDLRKHPRNVTFHLSPSIINDRSPQRKIFKHITYTSSEEGEVEEVHSDSYVLDDEKHRAKHNQSHGNFSSESEIYGEKRTHLSSKNDGKIPIDFIYKISIYLGIFSDEGGHVSDDRPQSRESMLNSEPEHE
jgi:hypothetical protein